MKTQIKIKKILREQDKNPEYKFREPVEDDSRFPCPNKLIGKVKTMYGSKFFQGCFGDYRNIKFKENCLQCRDYFYNLERRYGK